MTVLKDPSACVVSPEQGTMSNGTGRYTKKLADLAELYADSDAFAAASAGDAGSRIVYEVTEYRPSEAAGDLIFGVTRMEPGTIGEEYFMTRGHIHARANRPEIYYGQKGHGLMLMESPQGEVRIVEIGPQTVCYVPPFWIHRSVNTGTEEFVMVFSYPADSGQDYDIIARSGGMRSRIVRDGQGGWKAVDNAGWRPRADDEIARILAS